MKFHRLNLADAGKSAPSPRARWCSFCKRNEHHLCSGFRLVSHGLTVRCECPHRERHKHNPAAGAEAAAAYYSSLSACRFPKENLFMLATAESKTKLYRNSNRSSSAAANVIDHVMCNQPTDRLVGGDALEFRAAENLPKILITVRDREQAKVDQTLHRNAIYQMAHTTDMPVKFLDSMGPGRRPWQSRKGTCIGPGSSAS